MDQTREEGETAADAGQETTSSPAAVPDRGTSNSSGRASPSVSEGSWVAETGCWGSHCCNPRQGPYRFVGMIFMCFLGFGSYFCYDTPASLQNEIKSDMGVSTLQFSTLYSLYSWPNVVLCFVGGFLIDRIFGIRLGTLIFSTIVTIGHFVFAFGAIVNAFWVMQLGRFVFGVGGESLAVAQNAYTVSWFKGKELNFVFGLMLSMARIGSTVNFLVMEPIYEWVDKTEDGHVTLGITLAIGGLTCVFSLLCAVVLAILDRRRSRVLRTSAAQVGEKIQLKDIGKFPLSFWLISVICVTYYSAIFPFIGLSKVFFMYKYDLSSGTANTVSSIVYVISAVASPIFGIVVDKTGRNIMWVGVACFVTLCSHAIMAFTFVNPYIPMSIMGLSYSLLASSLWPMVALILPESQIGTAYGIMQSIQNLGLALISMLSGFVVDNYGYLMLEVLNLICLSLAVGSTGIIYVVDMIQDGGYLMKPNSKRGIVSPRVEKMLKELSEKKDKEIDAKATDDSNMNEKEVVVMKTMGEKELVDKKNEGEIMERKEEGISNEGYQASEDELTKKKASVVASEQSKSPSVDRTQSARSSSDSESSSEASSTSESSSSASSEEESDSSSSSASSDSEDSAEDKNDEDSNESSSSEDEEKVTSF